MRSLRCSSAPSIWAAWRPDLSAGPPAAPLTMYNAKSPSRSTGLFLALGAAMLLLAMLSQQPWAAGARGAARSAFAPAEEAMTSLAAQVDRVTAVFGDVSALRAENVRLRNADEALRRQIVELNAAAKENADLKAALKFEKASGHRMVAAQVIGLGPDGFSRTIEIDRGTADGVRAGMVVVTGAGLLGRVREAGPHSANVQTLADPQSRVNVYLSTSALQGTVSGGANALQLEVQHGLGVTASNGEWALTSGVGGGYPRGLVVGEIASVTRRDSATTDHAQVAWVNDPTSISFVLVITDFLPS
ncbi:MAG: rod shape-determining protein MreC [Chloroflexi bacterium]|nr:MAG: rod shape-determining protein MreC [Chloroflexota bacterium]TME42764.1 MAG: rod shape-determining protein MreC [Chloroflexota bacterium]TME53254.1 MAG: rod shape-determining protein MreC [Chloroflexota bacterium]